MFGTATIRNYNLNANAVTAAAGRISTLAGSADEIYEKSCQRGDEANVKLIHKILSSGHESVLEHISLNISFDNVSVFVEQFMIEFRLASFNVKSRRYVDFGSTGYVQPDFFNDNGDGALREQYTKHMEYLFGEYNAFLDAGVPKEDARFVLPYSFCSNFYCTVNARELIKIMNEMIWGRGSRFPELVKLGESLFDQCKEKLPYLCVQKISPDGEVQNAKTDFAAQSSAGGCVLEFLDWAKKDDSMTYVFSGSGGLGKTSWFSASDRIKKDDTLMEVISVSEEPEQIICQAAAFSAGLFHPKLLQIKDADTQKRIISRVIRQARRRELEQVHVTVLFRRISLAGLTHLVRHRMQSVVTPDLMAVCCFSNHVMPGSIVKAGLSERYRQVFAQSKQVRDRLMAGGLPAQDTVYLLLSGMTVPVMTTMNANELLTFFSLRTCSRAQWEIKSCADELLIILRKKYPVLFSLYGPSCFVQGKCPEGKMTCGKMEEVLQKYGNVSEVL